MGINLIAKMIENAINPQQDNAAAAAAAYQAQIEALAKKKEQERQERLARLQQMQNGSARKRINEDDQLTSMLDITGSNGSTGMESTAGGVLEGFDLSIPKIPENELQPRGTGRYDTSKLSFLQRLSCVNNFSQRALAAAKRGDHVNARYLNEQAQKVMSGQMTELECQCSDLPQPQPQEIQGQMAFYESVIKSVQEDAERLKDIEVKLREADEKIKQAEEHRAKVREQVKRLEQEYNKMAASEFEKNKDKLLSDFKSRYAATIGKNETIKAIRELNCSAYWGVEAAGMALDGKDDFARVYGEYSARAKTDGSLLGECPEIRVEIPPVGAPQPATFQKDFYQSIVEKADDLLLVINDLKDQKKKFAGIIAAKKKGDQRP